MAGGKPRGAWSDKAFRDALRVAVNKATEGGPKKLARLAETLVNNGLAGDTVAIREIADRLDGKPHQTQDIAVNDQRGVVRAPKPAASAEEWAESLKDVPKVQH